MADTQMTNMTVSTGAGSTDPPPPSSRPPSRSPPPDKQGGCHLYVL